jgi:hypothetical protein
MDTSSTERDMDREGPVLEALTHRLAECPLEMLAEHRIGSRGEVYVDAVVNDLILDLGGTRPNANELITFAGNKKEERALLRLVLVSAWLLHDEWFQKAGGLAKPTLKWLRYGLQELATCVAADLFVTDPDRREELVRLALAALGLRSAGETSAQAEDRLKTLNSVERARLIKATQAQQERARRLREELQRKKAAEAAAKVTREW